MAKNKACPRCKVQDPVLKWGVCTRCNYPNVAYPGFEPKKKAKTKS